jgi:hypothetical protein
MQVSWLFGLPVGNGSGLALVSRDIPDHLIIAVAAGTEAKAVAQLLHFELTPDERRAAWEASPQAVDYLETLLDDPESADGTGFNRPS